MSSDSFSILTSALFKCSLSTGVDVIVSLKQSRRLPELRRSHKPSGSTQPDIITPSTSPPPSRFAVVSDGDITLLRDDRLLRFGGVQPMSFSTSSTSPSLSCMDVMNSAFSESEMERLKLAGQEGFLVSLFRQSSLVLQMSSFVVLTVLAKTPPLSVEMILFAGFDKFEEVEEVLLLASLGGCDARFSGTDIPAGFCSGKLDNEAALDAGSEKLGELSGVILADGPSFLPHKTSSTITTESCRIEPDSGVATCVGSSDLAGSPGAASSAELVGWVAACPCVAPAILCDNGMLNSSSEESTEESDGLAENFGDRSK